MLDNVSPDRGLLRSIDDSSDAAGSNDDAVAVTFVPVHVGRASNLIVDQIRSLIRDGRLCLGDRLPSERELCEQFGVSRVTVREALRGLEANGLVSIRVGARGGAFVAAPTIQQVSEGIADLVAASVVRPDEVDEARRTFELGIVPLVCERADEQDIKAGFSRAIDATSRTLSTYWRSLAVRLCCPSPATSTSFRCARSFIFGWPGPRTTPPSK